MPADSYLTINAALTAMAQSVTKVIIHDGIATGDIPHVLAALTNHPERGVIVVDTKVKTGHVKVANVMVDQFKIPASRIKYVFPDSITVKDKKGTKRVADGRAFWLFPLTKSTDFFKDDLNAEHFRKVKQTLRGETLKTASLADGLSVDDQQHQEYLQSLGITFKANTVVLWGRESGRATIEANKPKEPTDRLNPQHPQYDHGYTGMQQIVKACADLGYQTIVAGDFRIKESVPRLYIQQHAQVIGTYWEVKEAYKDRKKQVRLFYVLKKILKGNGKNLVHVGMRSGGLDMLGLSGQKTIYIALQDADDRMAGVVKVVTEFVGRENTQFQKFDPARLPKRGTHEGKNKGGRTTEERGFLPEDLLRLGAQIKAAMAVEAE